jgi:hypothetical protein
VSAIAIFRQRCQRADLLLNGLDPFAIAQTLEGGLLLQKIEVPASATHLGCSPMGGLSPTSETPRDIPPTDRDVR